MRNSGRTYNMLLRSLAKALNHPEQRVLCVFGGAPARDHAARMLDAMVSPLGPFADRRELPRKVVFGNGSFIKLELASQYQERWAGADDAAIDNSVCGY